VVDVRRFGGIVVKQRVEEQLSFDVAQLLKLILPPSVRWTHLPFGEFRNKITANKLLKMGTQSGWSDYLLLYKGNAHFIELKKPKDENSAAGRLSPTQLDFAAWLNGNGFSFGVCYSVDDVLVFLKAWGIPHKEVR